MEPKKWLSKSKCLIVQRPWLIPALAIGLFAAFTIGLTFPFILDPVHVLAAPDWGDIAGSVSKYEALRFSHTSPFWSSHLLSVAYPDGSPNNIGVDRASVLSVAYLWLGSNIIGAIPTHSLMTVFGYLLTASVMFLFVRKVTGSALAGFIAGFSYGFWPHMYGLARAAMTYTHMWLFILPMWAFWSLVVSRFSWKRLMLAAFSIVPAVFWTPYYALHVLVVGGACLTVAGYWLWRSNGWKHALAVMAAIAATWLTTILIYRRIGLSGLGTKAPDRPLSDLYQQAAHPLMYVLPGEGSWGKHGNDLLVHLVPRADNTNLYLGLSVIALAATAIWLLFRAKANFKPTSANHHLVVAAMMATAVIVGCFVFSLPPTIRPLGLSLPTPNNIIALVVPALRAGQRFVMPLMAGMTLLSGIGASLILSRVKPSRRLLTAAGMILVIGTDLWALPGEHTVTLTRSTALASLNLAPAGLVAHYTHGSLVNHYIPCLYRSQYNKPLINDCSLGRSRDLGQILTLNRCDQISALRSLNTRYLILSPGDTSILKCLSLQHAVADVIAQDSKYEVVRLKVGDADTRAIYKPLPLLP